MLEAVSDSALFRVDVDGRVEDWNAAAERLTGIPRAAARGRPCWAVLRGVDGSGRQICRPGCTPSRLARAGRALDCGVLSVSGAHVAVSTILVGNGSGPVVLHPMAPQNGTATADLSPPRLTRRQHEVLLLLADGVRVKEVARRLGLAEATVRNHVRALLLELGAHSQLEAVAKARALALL
ncbi:MAG TPA: LuxR C-terminal-related transcriptional regulator [Gaiellaceae bacterium]|nr:LuxR C-terminal-related transcriptional regulator [Gaiellaceae bacterium]